MDSTWTIYAIYGFLIFVAAVVAPAVYIHDKKRRRRNGTPGRRRNA